MLPTASEISVLRLASVEIKVDSESTAFANWVLWSPRAPSTEFRLTMTCPINWSRSASLLVSAAAWVKNEPIVSP